MSIVPDKKLENKIILIVVILAAIAIPILGRFREAKSIPVFAIYPSADRADRAPSSIDKIQLLSQPLITDSDILEYRWTSHELLLTENAKKKLQSIDQQTLRGKLFVVMVHGERCYQGAFWLTIWSSSYPKPVIELDKIFRAQFVIERAYPTAKFAEGNDPRNNENVYAALVKVGKLKDQ